MEILKNIELDSCKNNINILRLRRVETTNPSM